MKSVLMSISPYYYYLIGEGIKRIEVRKVIPTNPNWNKTVECYMTKDNKSFNRIPKEFQDKYRVHMGKVGMRFRCGGIMQPFDSLKIMSKESCLTERELHAYADGKTLYGLRVSDLKLYDKPKELGEFVRRGYPNCEECAHVPSGMHPQEFIWHNDFCGECRQLSYTKSMKDTHFRKRLTRPPQSWLYVEG